MMSVDHLLAWPSIDTAYVEARSNCCLSELSESNVLTLSRPMTDEICYAFQISHEHHRIVPKGTLVDSRGALHALSDALAESQVCGRIPRAEHALDDSMRDTGAQLEVGLAPWPSANLTGYASDFAQNELRTSLEPSCPMQSDVFRLRHDLKVGQSVVVAVAVPVVNNFCIAQRTAESAFNDNAVLKPLFTADPNLSVSRRHTSNYMRGRGLEPTPSPLT